MEPSPARDEVFALGLPGKVGPVLLLAGGVGLMLLFGLASLASPGVVSLFFTGFGMLMVAFGWAMLFGRQNLVQLRIGLDGVTLSSSDASSATLPHAAVTDACVQEIRTTSTSTGSSASKTSIHYEIHLQKRDGGFISLGKRGKEPEAQELATGINAALLRHRPSHLATGAGGAAGSGDATDSDAADKDDAPERADRAGASGAAPADPMILLSRCSMVQAHRERAEGRADYRVSAREGPLVLEWSLRPTSVSIVPGIFAPSGMGCALYGFHLHDGNGLVLGASVFLFAIALFILARQIRDWGLVQRIRVDEEGLVIEKRRGETRAEQHRIPLGSVVAIDFSHTHDAMGGMLAVRTDGGPSVQKLAETSRQGVFSALRGILAYARDTVHVPLGRLPFGDKVRVDLALGAEIARRTARDDAGL